MESDIWTIVNNEAFIGFVSLLLGRFVVPFLPISLFNRIRKGGIDLVKLIDLLENLDNEEVRKRAVKEGLTEGSKLLQKHLGGGDA